MILAPGTVLGERYEIMEKIGAGGMSIVYKAKCNRLQRFVAVKVLREEFVKDEVFVDKFKVEALSAARLSQPNIVGIYDVGNDHEMHYIVMEYVEGQTLKELIAREGPLSNKMVLEYGLQMLSAIKHAHEKNIIHRDIKPQNILVTKDKALKVTDFGIARAVDSSTIVATGNAIGSVHYFSPEQAKGKYVNITSDIYSCGIVLFELATKRLPFDAESHVSIALKHINEEIPNPSEFNEQIPKGMEQIILKATNKKQELRYQSADEMIEDIKKVVADPTYQIMPIRVEEEMEHTVLLSEGDTNYIREHEKKEEENIPLKSVLDIEEVYDGYEEEEEESVKPMYKILAGIAGGLVAMLLTGIICVIVISKLPSLTKVEAVVVPKIEGQLLVEAERMAKERGLVIEVAREEESGSYEPGTIITQSPKVDATIGKNGVIQVVVAIDEKTEEVEKVEVPDVKGINQADAQRQLEVENLLGKVDERVHDKNLEVGKVISQIPEAGTMLLPGEVVRLIVSKGPEVIMTNVPNLLGQTVAQAQTNLEKANLELGNISEEYSATIATGSIIQQTISGNSRVEQGTKINVVISKGQEIVEPPVEEVPTEPEVPSGNEEEVPEEEQGPVEVPVAITKQHTINLPQGAEKEEYHVVIIFQTDQGTNTLYEGMIKRDEFPKTISLTGMGAGQLITHFDGQVEYNDDYSF